MSQGMTGDGLPAGYQLRAGYEITARDVLAMMRERPDGVIVVDVRTQAEWDLVHIEGSVHIPLDEIESRADEVRPEPGQVVATLCHHGVRSLKASLALRQLGVPGALSIAGGIEAWALSADATIARYERQGGRCWKV